MTSLTAHVSRSALAANAASALSPGAVVDLRRDAWGHGLPLVADVLAAVGVRAALVDDAGCGIATAAGLTVTDAAPTVDGAVLFGLPGSGGEPVLRLSARVLSLKDLRRGEGVSYGYAHRAVADTRVALVDGGYGQGLPRAIGGAASVEVAAKLHPIVGRIAMDVCVVDIGDRDVHPGDDVVYFGGSGPARDALATWSAASGLGAAEIVCAIGLHVRREDAA